MDTGARRAEVLGLRRDDVDLDTGVLTVTGKGSRTRLVVVGGDDGAGPRPLRPPRAKRPDAALPWLWLGRKGQLRETGLAELIRDRARQAGVAGGSPAPVPPQLRPRDARRRDAGDRPHGRRRLAEPRHADPLRGVDAGRNGR